MLPKRKLGPREVRGEPDKDELPRRRKRTFPNQVSSTGTSPEANGGGDRLRATLISEGKWVKFSVDIKDTSQWLLGEGSFTVALASRPMGGYLLVFYQNDIATRGYIFVFFVASVSYKHLFLSQREIHRWPKNQNVGLGRLLMCAP
jgi:hypothetical protein